MINYLDDKKVTVDEILGSAKTLYKNKKIQGIHPDWHDYENFKKKLHFYGIFGYEYELADILDL